MMTSQDIIKRWNMLYMGRMIEQATKLYEPDAIEWMDYFRENKN